MNVINKKSRKKGSKNPTKRFSFYGWGPRDVIMAFMQIDPEESKKIKDVGQTLESPEDGEKG